MDGPVGEGNGGLVPDFGGNGNVLVGRKGNVQVDWDRWETGGPWD